MDGVEIRETTQESRIALNSVHDELLELAASGFSTPMVWSLALDYTAIHHAYRITGAVEDIQSNVEVARSPGAKAGRAEISPAPFPLENVQQATCKIIELLGLSEALPVDRFNIVANCIVAEASRLHALTDYWTPLEEAESKLDRALEV